MQPSIAQLDRSASEAAQLRIDAEQGIALLNALARKWWEQGYNAAQWGLKPSGFWTSDHQRGYLAALATNPAPSPTSQRTAKVTA